MFLNVHKYISNFVDRNLSAKWWMNYEYDFSIVVTIIQHMILFEPFVWSSSRQIVSFGAGLILLFCFKVRMLTSYRVATSFGMFELGSHDPMKFCPMNDFDTFQKKNLFLLFKTIFFDKNVFVELRLEHMVHTLLNYILFELRKCIKIKINWIQSNGMLI